MLIREDKVLLNWSLNWSLSSVLESIKQPLGLGFPSKWALNDQVTDANMLTR